MVPPARHHIETDWANREVVVDSDARRIREEIERAGFESAQLHEAYSRYVEDWQRRQREAGEEAFQRAYEEGLQQQRAATPRRGLRLLWGVAAHSSTSRGRDLPDREWRCCGSAGGVRAQEP